MHIEPQEEWERTRSTEQTSILATTLLRYSTESEATSPYCQLKRFRGASTSQMAPGGFSSDSATGLRSSQNQKTLASRHKPNDGGGGGRPRNKSSCLPVLNLFSSAHVILLIVCLVTLVCRASGSSENSVTNSASPGHIRSLGRGHIYSNHFAVHVPAGEDKASEIATKHGFVNTGQVSLSPCKLRWNK